MFKIRISILSWRPWNKQNRDQLYKPPADSYWETRWPRGRERVHGGGGGWGGRLERAVYVYSPSLLPSVMVLVYGLRPQHGETISQTGTSVMPISITQAVGGIMHIEDLPRLLLASLTSPPHILGEFWYRFQTRSKYPWGSAVLPIIVSCSRQLVLPYTDRNGRTDGAYIGGWTHDFPLFVISRRLELYLSLSLSTFLSLHLYWPKFSIVYFSFLSSTDSLYADMVTLTV